jgi:hypothetical protein
LITSGLATINKALQEHSQEHIDRWHRGAAMNRYAVKAYSELLKVTRNVDATQSGITIAGVYLLREYDPRRFPSDAGFDGQLVRQYRLQNGLAVGRTFDAKRNRDTGWFRPLPKQTTQLIATILRDAYAQWVAHIVSVERRAHEARNKAAMDLAKGFAGV